MDASAGVVAVAGTGTGAWWRGNYLRGGVDVKKFVLEMIVDEQANGQWTEDFEQHDIEHIFHTAKEVIDSILREWGFYEGENYSLRAVKYHDDALDTNSRLPYGFRRTDDQQWIELDPGEQAIIAFVKKYLDEGLPMDKIVEILYSAGLYGGNKNDNKISEKEIVYE